MQPIYLLLGAMAPIGAAALVQSLARRRAGRALRDLAGQWGMRYARADPFGLIEKVCHQFPIAGAADLRVYDLVYAMESSGYRYYFTVEYTLGVVRAKRRHRRAGTFREAREGSMGVPLVLGRAEVPLVEQYQSLHDGLIKAK
jgi:hypothetical protein